MGKEDARLLNDDIKKLFFRYLIPSVGGMMGVSLYVLGDTIIVGRGLGAPGLAALNISIPLINVFNGLGLLFGIGGSTSLAINRGRKEFEKVNDIFTKSIILSLLVGIILTLVRVFFLDELVGFLGGSNQTFDMSRNYLGVLMVFSIPFLLNSALTVFVRNDGAPKLAMAGMLSGSVINIIFDYIFIIVLDWGMAGGALATGFSPMVGLIILSSHFIRKKNLLKLVRPKFELHTLKRIIGNGGASFVVEISAGIVIFAFNQVILGISGDIGVSAYSIIANLSLIFTAIFIGVGQAIQPIVSINYGAEKMERVYDSAKFAIFFSLACGAIFYTLGLLFPEFLISLFTKDNAELMDITVRGIRIYFLAFLFMGVNIVLATYVQSKEKAKVSLAISLLRGLVLIIVALLILPRFFGLDGVWMTLPVVEGLTLIISIIFFRSSRRAVYHSLNLELPKRKSVK